MIYHSGATEGINTFFKGVALKSFKEKKIVNFYFSTVDHACVVQLQDELETLGHNVYFFEVDKNGSFDEEALIVKINLNLSLTNASGSFINFTQINNETGVVWPQSIALALKEKTNAFVHVDAVQLPGKVANWNHLSSNLDAYTFSGHKFGALKGIGFSFVRKSIGFTPLLQGGNQQSGLRPGTENALGIYSLKLALEGLREDFQSQDLQEAKTFIELRISQLIEGKGEIIGALAKHRNLNTLFLVLYGQKAEILSAKFDLMGVDLSTGSACSSGIIKENRILMNMGHSHENSRSSLRFSFSPFMNLAEAKIYAEKIEKILKGILA